VNTKKLDKDSRKFAKRKVRRIRRSGYRIGLSVSFCIRDMAMGKVPVVLVERIVAGTATTNWDDLIARYRKDYWKGVEDKAEQICRQFLSEGRIYQPRLENGRVPFIGNTKWVSNTREIHYRSL
jgi:hypothetical protein